MPATTPGTEPTTGPDRPATGPERRPPRAARRRRGRAALGVLAAGALVLAACGSPPTSDSEGAGRSGNGGDGGEAELPECPLDALEEAEGKVEVTLWYGGLGGTTQQTMEGMAERFNASQDKVVVRANNQGVSYEEVLRKYEGVTSNTGQQPEIIYLEDTALGNMVDKGQVLPAQSCMEADDYDPTQITPAARSAFSVDGVLYPGYFNVSTPVLYYNKVHFQKAGLDPNDPPETLAEVREAAQTIKDAGIAPKPLSFKVNRWFFETWMAGVGEDVVDNDNGRSAAPTEATFATEQGVDLMTMLAEMNEAGLLNPFASTEGSIDHYLALLSEQSSMLVETSTAATTIRDALSGEITAEQAGIDFDESMIDTADLFPGVAPLPGIEDSGKVFASGGAFYILNTSSDAQQAASWEFLKFMLQPENAKDWHMNGSYLPVVKDVLDEPDIETFWEEDVAGALLVHAVEQLGDADPDQAGPLIGPYARYTTELQGAMERILLDDADPESTLTDADEAIDQILEDYNG